MSASDAALQAAIRQQQQQMAAGGGGGLINVDPNQPTKLEQFRLVALQHVSQMVAAGELSYSETKAGLIGTAIAKDCKAIVHFLTSGNVAE